MEPSNSPRITRLRMALRRLVRRNARSPIANLLSKTRPEDVAVVMRDLTPAEQLTVFGVLFSNFPDAVGDVLTELEPPQRLGVLDRLTPEQIGTIVERAPVDDAVFLIESLPAEKKSLVLDLVDRRDLTEVQDQLTYADDSAGRIMDPGFFAMDQSRTVGEAIATLREQSEVEMIFYLYVVDEVGHLMGVTSLRQLLLQSSSTPLSELMQSDLIKVTTATDQEVVAQLAARYDLLAIPVVDDDNKLAGIVTVDDIVDVLKEEATEDFYKMVGTSEDEVQYQERALRVAGIRLPWLLVNLVGLIFSGMLLEYFQIRYSEALFLLAFVPAIMGMAGNSGSQVSTITVRGLATGRLGSDRRNLRSFLRQQIKVGLYLGLIIGVISGIAALLRYGQLHFAIVVGVALLLVMALASTLGAVIPLLFQRIGVDPAVAASPLVTTTSDMLGILIYFGLVALILGYLMPIL
ncbi:MAG: magnesium transporter [Acidobacteriota bacterium]